MLTFSYPRGRYANKLKSVELSAVSYIPFSPFSHV